MTVDGRSVFYRRSVGGDPGRRADRARARLRDLRLLPDADRPAAGSPRHRTWCLTCPATDAASDRRPPSASRSWPASCWSSSTGSGSRRPCWSATRWAARSSSRSRTRCPSWCTVSCSSHPPAACTTSRCRGAGAARRGRRSRDPADDAGGGAGLRALRAAQCVAAVHRADPVPVPGAAAARSGALTRGARRPRPADAAAAHGCARSAAKRRAT